MVFKTLRLLISKKRIQINMKRSATEMNTMFLPTSLLELGTFEKIVLGKRGKREGSLRANTWGMGGRGDKNKQTIR